MTDLPTPEDVLQVWFGADPASPSVLETHAPLWFRGGPDFDRELTDRFQPLLETLAAGPLARDWAASGAKGRLAALIVLDQMSRNIFRGSPRAFTQDLLALTLAEEGLSAREDLTLSEAERVFFYLPLEHSEDMSHQTSCVRLYEALAADARAPFGEFAAMTLDYARKHLDVIAEFGRFPHRNAVVGRSSTDAEKAWLEAGGGF